MDLSSKESPSFASSFISISWGFQKNWETRMHSSRMLTVHLFTISRRIPCISGGSLTNPPCGQTLEVCSLLSHADPPGCRPPGCRPRWRQTPYIQNPGHVTCDVCWEANPPADRKTPVKTLPSPKLRLREVNIVRYL